MPKIPTFTTQARPTAEVGSIKSNIQIPLTQNIGTVLKPVTDAIVKHRVNEKNLEDKAEALTLENESIFKLNEVFDKASKLDNKEQAFNLIQSKSKTIQDEFSNKASNKFVKSAFNNSFLGEVQKGIFKTNIRVSKNVIDTLNNQVSIRQNTLLTQAYVSKDPMALQLIETDLENLYEKSYKGRVSVPEYNKMLQMIPGVIESFQVNQDISSNPKQAYYNLMNDKKYPNIDLKERIKFINQVETIMIQPMQKEFANVIFSLQDKGTEQPFDFEFAKKILPIEKYNELKTTYNVAKINAKDVRLIGVLPTNEADNLIENKNFNTDLYVGSADRITQSKLKEGLINARNNAAKQMLEDPVNFQIQTNPEIEELNNNYKAENNPQIKLADRKTLTNAIIEDQIKRKVDLANLKILTKQEVTQIKNQFSNTGIKSEDKLKLIEQLKVTYGDENMGMIVNHLQDEKTPETILMGISTDSVELAKDLFDSSSLEDLKKISNQKDPKQVTSLITAIAGKTEDFGQVLDSQGEGSQSKAAKMLRINEALLKVALVRTNKNVTAPEAASSAANDFLSDYVLNNALTALIPKTINKIPIPVAAVENKNEAILIGVKDDSPGNYLDRFMGEKGYMHYASSLNIPNLSEEDVKKRVGFTIRNYSRWLNNSDMTGMVLYADFAGSAGLQPVKNANGQRIEYYLADLPNQDPTIKNTISVYPVTGDELPLIPDPPSGDYFQYDEFLIDEIINNGKKNLNDTKFK